MNGFDRAVKKNKVPFGLLLWPTGLSALAMYPNRTFWMWSRCRVHQEVNRKVARWRIKVSSEADLPKLALEQSSRSLSTTRVSILAPRGGFRHKTLGFTIVHRVSRRSHSTARVSRESTQRVTDKFDWFLVLSFSSRVEGFIDSQITETRMGVQTASSQIEAWPLSSLVLFCFLGAGAACLKGGSMRLGLGWEGGNPLQTQPVSKKPRIWWRNSIKKQKWWEHAGVEKSIAQCAWVVGGVQRKSRREKEVPAWKDKHFSGFRFGTSYESGIKEAQQVHSLPEGTKLWHLPENQDNKGSLEEAHWRSHTSSIKCWWLDYGRSQSSQWRRRVSKQSLICNCGARLGYSMDSIVSV